MFESHRKWPQDMTPSCGLNSWAVDLSQSIEKWRYQDRDTLANQKSLDTNVQSHKCTESPVAVPIDVRVCSSLVGKERHR